MLAPSLFAEDVICRPPPRDARSAGGRSLGPRGRRSARPGGRRSVLAARRGRQQSGRIRRLATSHPPGQFRAVNCDFARSPRSPRAKVKVADRDGQVPARAGGYVCAVLSASHLSLRCGRPRYVAIFRVKSDELARAGPGFEVSEGLRRLDDISISPGVRNATSASRIRPCATADRASRVLPAHHSNETVEGAVLAAGVSRCSRSSRG